MYGLIVSEVVSGLLELIAIVNVLQKDFFQALVNRCLLVFRRDLTSCLDIILYSLAHLHDLLLLFLMVVLLLDLLYKCDATLKVDTKGRKNIRNDVI